GAGRSGDGDPTVVAAVPAPPDQARSLVRTRGEMPVVARDDRVGPESRSAVERDREHGIAHVVRRVAPRQRDGSARSRARIGPAAGAGAVAQRNVGTPGLAAIEAPRGVQTRDAWLATIR